MYKKIRNNDLFIEYLKRNNSDKKIIELLKEQSFYTVLNEYFPNASLMHERINKRVDIMLEQGLIQEVEELLKKYHEFPTAMQGLGYKEVVEYLQGETTREEMIEKIKMETRRYAKRQITWFKKNKQTIWIGAQDLQKILDEI